jgi:predicted P-loop ATPase
MDKRRIIDTTRVVISAGRPTNRGTGLGKVEQTTFTLKKLRERFAEPLVDVNTPWSKYLKLQKIAKDLDHPKHKEAADQILGMKMSAGNWTAARYEGKSRKVTDIVAKTMLVLDIDHANPDQVLDIRSNLTPVSEFYWLAHTSRSHYPEKPKFRMAFPVSREMKPDEAHAVLRHLSTYLLDDPEEAIEIVDTVTFRPNQTMFWPSISKGQDYWWDENLAGDILDVDEFLARHPGWEDFATLPYQVGEKKQGLKDPNVKMENPLEKPEPIGAFCRTYSIEDAIEKFLPEIYTPSASASDVRYNYEPGSGLNGAVVYDDGLFLLSQHSSDPASGLHNAFDLVRLHLFEHLDENVHGNTNPGNLPSYKAMVEFCRKDDDVVAEEYAALNNVLDDLDDDDEDDEHDSDSGDFELDGSNTNKKSGDLSDELDDLPEEDPEVDDLLGEEKPKPEKKEKVDKKWLAKLRRKANGDVDQNASYNVSLICKNHPVLKGRIGYNEFTQDPVCLKPIRSKKLDLPQPAVIRKERGGITKWAEENDMAVKLLCSYPFEDGGLEADFSKDNIQIGIVDAAHKNRVHPVRDMLQEWHGTWKAEGSPRGELERMAIDHLGCPDTPYYRESAVKFMVASVARIMEPGCKFDQMVIIRGETGSRKSSYWQVLFNGYCTELKVELNDTGRLIEAMRGWWCLEMAEMVQARRADNETLKRELSSVGDQHRLAYARRETFWWRRNVFVGTENNEDFLSDPTSVRRYWIWVTTKTRQDPIDTDLLMQRLWALWGEAYQVYLDMRAAQPHGDLFLDLSSREAIEEQTRIAESHRKQSVTEEIAEAVQEWLDTPVPAEEAMVDKSGLTLDGYEGDDTPMIRNMVTAKEAFEALAEDPSLRRYRNVRPVHFGHALAKLDGWRSLGKQRRHDQAPAVWYCRGEDGDRWVPAPEPSDEVDDLLS